MQCPKCGSSQPVTNKECPSCGIIFDRWQPRMPRKTTASSTPAPSTSADDPDSSSVKVPTPVVVVGAIFLVIFGVLWTRHSRENRAKNADDLLNQINNSGAKLRRDLSNQRTATRGGPVQSSAVANGSALPNEISESSVAAMIERCRFFQEDVTVEIPKHVNRWDFAHLGNSTLAFALDQHLVEMAEPIDYRDQVVAVNVTQYASSRVSVSSRRDLHVFGLGRRHVTVTRLKESAQGGLEVVFTWTLDSDFPQLTPEGPHPVGTGWVTRTATTDWKPEYLSVKGHNEINLGCE